MAGLLNLPDNGFRHVQFCKKDITNQTGADLKDDTALKCEFPGDLYMKIPYDTRLVSEVKGECILAIISHDVSSDSPVRQIGGDTESSYKSFPKRLRLKSADMKEPIVIPVNEETTLKDCLSMLKNRGESRAIVELAHVNTESGQDVPIYKRDGEGELKNKKKTFEHFSDIADEDEILIVFAEKPPWPKQITFRAGDQQHSFPILKDNTISDCMKMLKTAGENRDIDRITMDIEDKEWKIYVRDADDGTDNVGKMFGDIFSDSDTDIRLQVYFKDKYGEWPIHVKFIVRNSFESHSQRVILMELNEEDKFQTIVDNLKMNGVRGRIVGLTHAAMETRILYRDEDGNLVGADKKISEDSQVAEGDEIEVNIDGEGPQWPQYFVFKEKDNNKEYNLPLCGEHSIKDILNLLKTCGVQNEVIRLYDTATKKDFYRVPESGANSLNKEDAEERKQKTIAELLFDMQEGNVIGVIVANGGTPDSSSSHAGGMSSGASAPGACGYSPRNSSAYSSLEGTTSSCIVHESEDNATNRLHFKIKNRRNYVQYDHRFTLEEIMKVLKIDYEDPDICDIRVKSKSLYKKVQEISLDKIMKKTLGDFQLQPADYIELIYKNSQHSEPFHVVVDGVAGRTEVSVLKDEIFTNFDLKEKIVEQTGGFKVSANRCHLFEYHRLPTHRSKDVTDSICFYKPLYDIDRPPLLRCSHEQESLMLWKDCEFVDLKEREVINEWNSKWLWGDESNAYWVHGVKLENKQKSVYFVQLVDGDFINVETGEMVKKGTSFAKREQSLTHYGTIKDRKVSLFIAFLKKTEDVPIFIPDSKQILRLHCRLTDENADDYGIQITEKVRFDKLMDFACVEGFWVNCKTKTAKKVTDKCRKAHRETENLRSQERNLS